MRVIEEGVGIKNSLIDIPKNINVSNISMAILSLIFSWTGVLFLVGNAQNAGFTFEQSVSWVFGAYVAAGTIGIIMSLKYKLPIAGAFSIPGATLVGASAALSNFTINEVTGAFFVAGVIVLILGITGIMKKIVDFLPQPIIMAMVAGVLIRYGIGIVSNIQAMPLVGSIIVLTYLLSMRFLKKIPPILPVLVVAAVVSVITSSGGATGVESSLVLPQFYMPKFSLSAIISIGIPLAILVVGAENAQAVGVLKANGYKTPTTSMTIASGIGGMVASLFGAHSANIAGPVTAVCAGESAGPKEGRYIASFLAGLGSLVLFGIFAPIAVKFTLGIPGALLNLLLGIVLIGVLTSSFKGAFTTNKFNLGVFTALIVAMSNIVIFKISSPCWALVAGMLVSLIAEPSDFKVADEDDIK